jgi:hypothetical protein
MTQAPGPSRLGRVGRLGCCAWREGGEFEANSKSLAIPNSSAIALCTCLHLARAAREGASRNFEAVSCSSARHKAATSRTQDRLWSVGGAVASNHVASPQYIELLDSSSEEEDTKPPTPSRSTESAHVGRPRRGGRLSGGLTEPRPQGRRLSYAGGWRAACNRAPLLLVEDQRRMDADDDEMTLELRTEQ